MAVRGNFKCALLANPCCSILPVVFFAAQSDLSNTTVCTTVTSLPAAIISQVAPIMAGNDFECRCLLLSPHPQLWNCQHWSISSRFPRPYCAPQSILSRQIVEHLYKSENCCGDSTHKGHEINQREEALLRASCWADALPPTCNWQDNVDYQSCQFHNFSS